MDIQYNAQCLRKDLSGLSILGMENSWAHNLPLQAVVKTLFCTQKCNETQSHTVATVGLYVEKRERQKDKQQ